MIVGIDAHYLGFRQSGNETYVKSLIKSFAELDKENHYRIYLTHRDTVKNLPVVQANFEYRFIQSTSFIRVSISFPWELLRRPVDIFQVHYNAPLIVPCQLVLIMHDISWAIFPHYFPYFKGRQITLRAKLAVKQAEKVVVGSQFMKEEVMKFYQIPAEKIVVIPMGVDEKFKPLGKKRHHKKIAGKYQIDREFILYIGDLQPRKNLPRLIEAFARLKKKNLPHQLVIVGKKAWHYKEIFAAVDKFKLDGEVVFTGYVPESDLIAFYNAAEVFVYPSLYEGFGLPLLEAMACGTPVVASKALALAETVGGAAILFDPLDVDSIASTICQVLSNNSLKQELRLRGIERAQSFSWKATAEKTLALYQEILRG